MELENVIRELREEKELVEAAIIALERLAASAGKRRGRPPKWLSALSLEEGTTTIDRKKRTFSDETRKRMSEAQRKRFASRSNAEEA